MTIKFISRKAHGIMDWLMVGMLPVIPRACGWDRKVRRLHDMAAGSIAASSAFTNDPTGIIKLMPMKTHLLLDKMQGGLFLASAAVMTDEPCAARWCMSATGLFLLVQGFCTRTQPREHAPREDAPARQEPIKRYAEEMRPDIYGTTPGSRVKPMATSGL